MPLTAPLTAAMATASATSAEAIGWMSASGTRTTLSAVAESAIVSRNSKNCVACTIVYGMGPELMSCSCASLAWK
jgi:hypothetical protein